VIKRKRRTYILVQGNEQLRRELAREITAVYPVREIEAPHNGLVMMKMRETAHNSLFYLGELLVSEAKVAVNETFGLGVIAGNHPEAARDLAVIDAACNAHLPETFAWEDRLLDAEKTILARRAVADAKIVQTLVSFETMVET
jgi:alpha-D-ribose 1-methylphosphonate 5-triphosphate synthase subunit PhnG